MKLTGYYTTAGEKIAAGLLAGKTLSISRITAGSGSTALSAAALAQEQQTLGPCTPEVSGTTAVLRCTLSSDQARAPYFLRELGVYAIDDTGNEALYLIFRLDEEVSINPAFRLVIRFNLEQTLSDGTEVKVTAPLTGLATQEDLKGKADLVNGQVPYAQIPQLTGHRTLYVDLSGDDANPGTQDQPFRTIQAAINSLPKNLGISRVKINVSPGVYGENVLINGFIGGTNSDCFELTGSDSADTTRQINSLVIANNACAISVRGFNITGSVSGHAVIVSGSKANLLYLNAVGGGSVSVGIGAGISGSTQTFIDGCIVDGYSGSGIVADRASVANIQMSTVKNCSIGVRVGGGASRSTGIMLLYEMTFQGNSTDRSEIYGGKIFEGE